MWNRKSALTLLLALLFGVVLYLGTERFDEQQERAAELQVNQTSVSKTETDSPAPDEDTPFRVIRVVTAPNAQLVTDVWVEFVSDETGEVIAREYAYLDGARIPPHVIKSKHVHVRVADDDYSSRFVPLAEVMNPDNTRGDLAAFKKQICLYGRVYEGRDQRGLSDVMLYASHETKRGGGNIRTDPQGRYSMLLTPGMYSLSIWHFPSGREPRIFPSQKVFLDVDDEAARINGVQYDIELPSAVLVSGQVQNTEGQPLVGVTVSASDLSSEAKDQSDANGHFRIEWMTDKSIAHIDAVQWSPKGVDGKSKCLYDLPGSVTVSLQQGRVENLLLTLVRRDEAVLRGRVLNQYGEPPRIAKISCDKGGTRQQISRETGEFILWFPTPGTYNIEVDQRPNGQDLMFSMDIGPGDANDYLEITIQEDDWLWIAGWLRGPDNNLIRHPTVFAKGPRGTGPTAEITNAEWFLFDGLEPGLYDLKAYCDEYGEVSLNGVEAGTQDVMLVFPRRGFVEGIVVDGRTGEPVRDFEVSLPRFGKHFMSKDGRFSAGPLLVKSGNIAVSATGYATHAEPIEIPSGETRFVRIELYAEGTIHGIVTDENGASIPGVPIHLVDKVYASPREVDKPIARTNHSGLFTIRGTRLGERFVWAWPSEYEPASVPVTVVSGQDAEVSIVVRRGGIINVHVEYDGVPRAGCSVKFDAAEFWGDLIGDVTNENGNSYIKGIPEGRGSLELTTLDGKRHRQGVVLENGETKSCFLYYRTPKATVFGQVLIDGAVVGDQVGVSFAYESHDTTKCPASHHNDLDCAEWSQRRVNLDENGNYVISGAPDGEVYMALRLYQGGECLGRVDARMIQLSADAPSEQNFYGREADLTP